MKKIYFIFIWVLLLSCSGNSSFSKKQYTSLHYKTRYDHIDLVQHCAPTIDTMLQTMINMLEEDEEQDECLRSWHKTKTFIHEAEIQNKIYVTQMILNEETTPLHTNMWDAHEKIIGIDSDLGYDIELAIRANDRDKAVTRLKDLKTLMGTQWDNILKAAMDYVKIVFGEPNK